LHGNAKKKETAPDNSEDNNVFDIEQGVSINIFVKTGKKNGNELAKIYHYDLYGKRHGKYNYLLENKIDDVKWQNLFPVAPEYFFVPKDFSLKEEYENGFSITELFPVNSSGVKTQRDDASIKFTKSESENIKNDFLNLSEEELKRKYGFENVRDWNIIDAKSDLKTNKITADKIQYRPFDFRNMLYTGKTKGVMGYPRYEVMQHFIKGYNIGLITCRQQSSFDFQHIFITNYISDINSISLQSKEISFCFPLYLYVEHFGQMEKVANLNEAIVQKIAGKANNNSDITSEQFFDYIYANLHSPSYREKYKEFLKIDFPRIPYPENAEQFNKLATFGEKLRHLHLMENITVSNNFANFPKSGDNKVENLFTEKSNDYQENKVWINDSQYFGNVPEIAWKFYIGGYQPAQKWLKDRKGRTLTYEDIAHYQKIIFVLNETDRFMKEIDITL
jgi:predicted helicase